MLWLRNWLEAATNLSAILKLIALVFASALDLAIVLMGVLWYASFMKHGAQFSAVASIIGAILVAIAFYRVQLHDIREW